jgi:hypothetical protein
MVGVDSGAVLNVNGTAMLAAATSLGANGTVNFTTNAQTIASLAGSGTLN